MPARRQPASEKPAATFQLRGLVETVPGESCLPLSALRKHAKVVADFRPAASRSAAPERTVTVRSTDLIEIELTDGQRLWMSAEEYRRRQSQGRSRQATSDAKLDIVPAAGQLQVLPRAMQTRGPVSWAVKSLRVIGLDLAKITASTLASQLDNKTSPLKRPALGLHRCRMETGRFELTPIERKALSAGQSYLLLLHGTASSTWGSFGDLWSADRGDELRALHTAYPERVLAFEHATLTEDPVANALDLLGALPKGARLHIVSHSRGGLIGELLCRAQAASGPPFTRDELQMYRQAASGASATRVGQLQELGRRLEESRPTVERFVRVACPALGTTLASRRLDRWLSVIGNVGSGALPATPLADWFADIADFMAAVISKRTDPSTLPGLEALMPESALIRLINWPTAEVRGDLAVIAGDIDPDAWWTRLLVWVTDRFYEGDHDLVINTASMYGGARRTGAALASIHKGPAVNHFNYFANRASAEALLLALSGPSGELPGFQPLNPPPPAIPRSVVRSAGPRPTVFVIPGIMGSELHAGRDRVWLNIAGLLFGAFKKLSIDASDVMPVRPLPAYYGTLIRFLEKSHTVVPFPFDWRLPIEAEADRLARRVTEELDLAERARMPVRLLAHSMGGLVSRTMIARHPDVWRRMCRHEGARLIQLGTPNGGSHAVTELLVGKASALKSLALVDLSRSRLELLKIIARFPGVLAMLPKDPREDYFSPDTWAAYATASGKGWIVPATSDLARARRFRDLIDAGALDPERTIYVAGNADVTIASMELDAGGGGIRFLGTTRGDGRVTWDSGIPAGVPVWYMDVEHGDLCNEPDTFPALKELLERGQTSLLARTPRVARGAVDLFPVEPKDVELYPSEDVLVASVLGAGSRKHKAPRRAQVAFGVSVAHGDLAYSRYPVAVGHYTNDAIVSAEKYLDMALGGDLTRRHLLGRYPGPIGTAAVFTNPPEGTRQIRHPGAIVVGLGTPGQLTAGSLSRTFMQALLEYVVEAEKVTPEKDNGAAAAAEELKSIGVSTLLIGSGAGGVTVSDCVYAVITGVELANQALEMGKQKTRIGSLHLIELWEDRAIQAVEALQELALRPDLQGKFNPRLTLERTDGGLRRLRYEEPPDWWHRLQILGGGKEGEPADGTLRFSASTRRARSEVRLQRTQRALVDGFIESAVRETTDNKSVAGTLFEILLPNELKDQAPDRGNLVLLVDEDAARYPWELLRDPARPEAPPPSIEQGMLRQLESYEFRENVRPGLQNTALVIGDPVSSFPELPGARIEAEAVWQSLRGRGEFRVEKRIRPTAQEVMTALHERPYRVVHLAGHGVYRYPGKDGARVTGMVLGDDTFLTPDEIRKMRQVPELVFINCCHLGHIEGASRSDYNQLAANIATECIRMGVRAVVAAGWAVDDDAAALFGHTLYDRLLAGTSFGRAVHEARIAVYQQYPRSNTWGAYQCYGDPHWKLLRTAGDGQATQEKQRLFASPSQAAVELQNLAAQLRTGALSPESGRQRVTALVGQLEKARFLSDPLVLAPLGRAYAEAQLTTEAILTFRFALHLDKAHISISDIEMLANIEARDAVRLAQERKPNAAQATRLALAQVNIAIRRLEALGAVAAADQTRRPAQALTSVTTERLALLASAYKRKAWISSSARERLEALERCRAYYAKAYARRKDPYPFLNLLAAEIVLGWHKRARSRDLEQLLARELPKCRAALHEAFVQDRSFWNSAMLADLDLLDAMAEKAPDAAAARKIAAAYRAAAERGSPREFASVREQLAFLADLARKSQPGIHRWLSHLHTAMG